MSPSVSDAVPHDRCPFPPPQCYIFLAYIAAMAPPGYICNLMAAGRVLHNMLKVREGGRVGEGVCLDDMRLPGGEGGMRLLIELM